MNCKRNKGDEERGAMAVGGVHNEEDDEELQNYFTPKLMVNYFMTNC